jgi:hypothetical protein
MPQPSITTKFFDNLPESYPSVFGRVNNSIAPSNRLSVGCITQPSRTAAATSCRITGYIPGAEALVSSHHDNVLNISISNGIEALGNLIYLICEDADHPPLVRRYANMCEERLRAMASLVKSVSEQP